jgi:hypothetical protein
MSLTFGDRVQRDTTLEPGMYDATISKVELVTEPSGEPKLNKSGREQIDVHFDVEGQSAKRRYAISFGQNSETKAWSGLSTVIQAATGIKCGEKDQRSVNDRDLVGKAVRIVLEENGDYINVTTVMPASKTAKPASKPQPSALGSEPDDDLFESGDPAR